MKETKPDPLMDQFEDLLRDRSMSEISFLIDLLEQDADDGAEAAWESELANRVAEIRSGRVVGKPADQVFAELREQFP